MRASSPTGGALGNVTEKELAFLQASVASLEATQSAAGLKTALQDGLRSIAQSRRRINEAAAADGADMQERPKPAPPDIRSQADAILNGKK